jgi:hypothetical protein
MKINIELPFFPGFYESDLENSDTSYWAIKEELDYYRNDCETPCKELTEDDFDFNYSDYEKDVREQWVEGFRDNAPEFVVSVENVEMTSPKYYNFSTDKLWADIELKDGWEDDVRKFMDENADWLRKRIKDDWTSYDGFMSFMSNNFGDTSHDEDEDYWGGDKSWYWHLFSGQSDRWECYISTIIGYMMYRKNKDVRNDMVMRALDDVYAGSYVFITKDAEDRIKEAVENGEVQLYDPAQLEIPFE